MLIVRWELQSGTGGEDVVLAGDKWVFGRAVGEERPTVEVDDPRVSRAALVVRDGGGGPLVFRGQRGENAEVSVRAVDGSVQVLQEGTAGNLSNQAHRVEMSLGGEHLITLEVDFADRPSVVERQQQAESAFADQG
ncbi:hypothetical protein ACHAAC_14270 [Aeromicrobium sp. CF4.19]|uniref:hypothetical protein n=1 Tax=Aeromicrobium sp. CF4.19 TaxID=3373082 RepID=UPI003EE56D2C